MTAWGSVRASRAELTRVGEPFQVGLIQGNADQSDKNLAVRAASIFQDYLRMTRQAIGAGADLVMWPESSVPFMFNEDRPAAEQVRTLARQARVPILLGSDEIEWREQNGRKVPDKYYNSAFLVRPDGTAGVYRKIHLVPFGEYVPLRGLLFFAAPLVEAVGAGFVGGTEATLLPVRGHSISVAICYEIVYPDLVRQFVKGGSELLTTITNDAWFGATSAPYQHFAGLDAGDRERPLSRAIGKHRHQRHRRSLRLALAQTDIFQPAVIVSRVRS